MNFVTVLIIFAVVWIQIYNSFGIYSGKISVKGQFPYVVKVIYYFNDRTNRTKIIYRQVWKFVCTGVIINKNYVLSSAGCFQHVVNVFKKRDYARFNLHLNHVYDHLYCRGGIVEGTKRYAAGFQERRAQRVIVHPDYLNKSTMFDVDLALIQMWQEWDLTKDPTQVAAVPRWGMRINEHDWMQKCVVAGYGYTTWQEYDDDLLIQCLFHINYEDYTWFPEFVKGNILRYYRANAGRERYCKYLRKNLGRVGNVKGEVFDDFYMCALPMNASARQGPCFGDIGAPLICDGSVMGIMSQIRSKRPTCDIRGANDNTAFTVYTSVGADESMRFIKEYIPDFPALIEVSPGNPYDNDYDDDELIDWNNPK